MTSEEKDIIDWLEKKLEDGEEAFINARRNTEKVKAEAGEKIKIAYESEADAERMLKYWKVFLKSIKYYENYRPKPDYENYRPKPVKKVHKIWEIERNHFLKWRKERKEWLKMLTPSERKIAKACWEQQKKFQDNVRKYYRNKPLGLIPTDDEMKFEKEREEWLETLSIKKRNIAEEHWRDKYEERIKELSEEPVSYGKIYGVSDDEIDPETNKPYGY